MTSSVGSLSTPRTLLSPSILISGSKALSEDPWRRAPSRALGPGSNSPGSFYASALLVQDPAYSYRVWITLIKLLYALLWHLKTSPDIHLAE